MIKKLNFDFYENNDIYQKILDVEKFDFNSKKIEINVNKNEIKIFSENEKNVKIAENSIFNTLKIITKTLSI